MIAETEPFHFDPEPPKKMMKMNPASSAFSAALHDAERWSAGWTMRIEGNAQTMPE